MYDRPYNNSLWTSHFQSTVFQSIVTKHENQKKKINTSPKWPAIWKNGSFLIPEKEFKCFYPYARVKKDLYSFDVQTLCKCT